MSSSDFKVNESRDASDSIRGYVYQIYQSVLAWCTLKDDEILVLEGAENFDVHMPDQTIANQVKDKADNITLRSSDVLETLNNFWEVTINNAEYNIFYRFLTTANIGQEQKNPFGKGIKGIEFWNRVSATGKDVNLIREFILELELSEKLKRFVEMASDQELLEKFIGKITWHTGLQNSDGLEAAIKNKLIVYGLRLGVNSHYAEAALPALLKYVADQFTHKGQKEISLADFIREFDKATTVNIPRDQLNRLMEASSSNAMMSSGPNFFGLSQPLASGVIPRTGLVNSLIERCENHGVLFLYGSSGLGKTHVAALLASAIPQNWSWANFRNVAAEQVKSSLKQAVFELNAYAIPPFIVLDDLDFSQSSVFMYELSALVFSVWNSGGLIIFTSQTPPVSDLLVKLWLSEECSISIPYFDENDISELAHLHSLSDHEKLKTWSSIIYLNTGGHPQLVHARVRALSGKGWPAPSPEDLKETDDISQIRREVRTRLLNELPSEGARTLIYRLSLIAGSFSRDIAISLAGTPPPISLPGEAFDTLVGPWVETVTENTFRISPLLKGAANQVFSKSDINTVHEGIAFEYIKKKNLSEFEMGTALFHAIAARAVLPIMGLSKAILEVGIEYMPYFSHAISWLPWYALEDNQYILKDNPNVEVFFRLAQYRVASAIGKGNEALKIVNKIEICLKKIEPKRLRFGSEFIAYAQILNTIENFIPAGTVIRMLGRIIDLPDELQNVDLPEGMEPFDVDGTIFSDLPVEGIQIADNLPAQVLFSYQAVRIAGMNDLAELVDALDALPETKRELLLRVCVSDVDFAGLLISNSWWREVAQNKLNTEAAYEILNHVMKKAHSWQCPQLVRSCIVARSVLLDEYDKDLEKSLTVLDEGLKEFPDEVNILNQKAKVLSHMGKNEDVLSLCKIIQRTPGLPIVEQVFMHRMAGMCACELGQWKVAADFYLEGCRRVGQSDDQRLMGIGLKADAAFMMWKLRCLPECLQLFAEVLADLKNVPVSEDLYSRHLHATVRHTLAWIYFDEKGEHSDSLIEPVPGMCSNQSPHEGMKDHKIHSLTGIWELIGSLGKNLGLEHVVSDLVKKQLNGKRTILMELSHARKVYDELWVSHDFENLIPALMHTVKSAECIKNVEDGWKEYSEYHLPEDFWVQSENEKRVFYSVLSAAITLTSIEPRKGLPIEKWGFDLKEAGAYTKKIGKFLEVFVSEIADDDFYEQSAEFLYAIRSGHPDPMSLWQGFYNWIGVFIHGDPNLEQHIEKLAIEHWLFAASRQRFAFNSPALVCPQIEECCDASQQFIGLSRLAKTLDCSAYSLNINLGGEAKRAIQEIKRNGKIVVN